MTVKIVQLNENNLDILDHYDEDIFDGKVVPHRLAAALREPNHILLAAIIDGVVIGQVLAVIHRHPDKPTELYIDDLAVSERVQRRGIATRMLEELFVIGRQSGCEEVWVATEPDNEPAKKFYASLSLTPRDAVVFEGDVPNTDL